MSIVDWDWRNSPHSFSLAAEKNVSQNVAFEAQIASLE